MNIPEVVLSLLPEIPEGEIRKASKSTDEFIDFGNLVLDPLVHVDDLLWILRRRCWHTEDLELRAWVAEKITFLEDTSRHVAGSLWSGYYVTNSRRLEFIVDVVGGKVVKHWHDC